MAAVLTSVVLILQNTRALPGEFRKTSEQFFQWYGDYDAWKGHWTNATEGLVDVAELNLSKDRFRLNIDASAGGAIAGSLATKGICERLPFFEELLVEGTISSASRAEITAFDFVGGKRTAFASATLRRDGDVMTVSATNDPAGVFPKEARIALDPDDDLNLAGEQEPLCADKKERFIRGAVDDVPQLRKSKSVP
ncbi:hypothetical protein [Sphingomonas lutea]|uniref:hypothetical protein n=1 Tax=Sphingomonas lutea TaxID=1045317 RepID=UPI0031E8F448